MLQHDGVRIVDCFLDLVSELLQLRLVDRPCVPEPFPIWLNPSRLVRDLAPLFQIRLLAIHAEAFDVRLLP